jgi:LAS superfamily LD-carboxypeptidase LdcB
MNGNPKVASALAVGSVVLAVAAGFGWYRADAVSRALESFRAEAAATIAGIRADLDAKAAELETSKAEVAQLAEQIAAEKEKSDELAQEKRKAERKADELEDLAKLDPELLSKYSKVFFLNENYAPPKLKEIPAEYRSPEGKEMQLHREVLPYLTRMLEAAADDDVNVKVTSAYRSFGEQAELKDRYKVTYGASSANAFSADQGYSEHQLGTTVDLTSPEIGGGLAGFDSTEAFAWLSENAYKYGFILSYPEGNSYYVYEPWHWRFVGEDLARYIHKKKVNFYDMDQRDIDSYLGEIFD